MAMRWVLALACAASLASVSASANDVTVSHGISAFGQLKYSADFTHFGYVNPDAPKGGEISVRPTIATRTFDSFNPFIFKGDAADGYLLTFDTLMARAYDEPDALYGLLAESVEYPADRSYVIFNLREQARFSDGSPVTADDVAWSILTMRDRANPRFRLPLKDVEAVEALGPLQVRVGFADGAPTRDLIGRVAQLPIFSKAFYDTRDFEEASLEPPIYSGPYEIEKFSAGKTITYRLREDYWAKDLPVRRGQYNFDQVVYEYFPDHDIAREAFKADEFDLNEVYLSRAWATQYDFAAIDDGWVVKELISDGRPSGTQGFFINSRKDKFSDPRVRQAIGMVFDFEWSNASLFYGIYTRTHSFFENSDLMAEGPPTEGELAVLEPFRDQLDPSVFEEAYLPPVTDGSGRNRAEIRAAAKLLDEAGWKIDGQFRKNDAGEVLTVEFLDRVGSSFDRIVDPYIANLRRLGVDASLRQVDPAQYERRAKSFDFDVATARFPLSPTPGPELRGYLSSESAGAEGSFNLAGVSDPVIDGLIEKVNAATSRDELRNAAKALDRVFRAGHYWAPHWNKASHSIVYWDRFGRPQDLGIDKPPFDRAILTTWWYDPAKSNALAAKMSN
ncbi:MAG: extracellular solute-binding protein [Pseudomonadota bacterium]